MEAAISSAMNHPNIVQVGPQAVGPWCVCVWVCVCARARALARVHVKL